MQMFQKFNVAKDIILPTTLNQFRNLGLKISRLKLEVEMFDPKH
jgi:hypothetical protein